MLNVEIKFAFCSQGSMKIVNTIKAANKCQEFFIEPIGKFVLNYPCFAAVIQVCYSWQDPFGSLLPLSFLSFLILFSRCLPYQLLITFLIFSMWDGSFLIAFFRSIIIKSICISNNTLCYELSTLKDKVPEVDY